MSDLKDSLRKLIEEKRYEKTEAERLRKEQLAGDRSAVLQGVGQDLAQALYPALERHLEQSRMTSQEIRDAVTEGIMKGVNVAMPEINVPELKMPDIKVDVSSIERAVRESMASFKFEAPVVNVPETAFPERMVVSLADVDKLNPLPMMMVDSKGRPAQFGSSVSGGGKSDFLTIKDIRGSTASIIDQIDGALKITGSLSATLSLDYGVGEVGGNTARFVQATDATSSVNVVDAFGSTAVTSVFNADNRVRVSVETGGSGLTDSELRASSVPVAQASGALWSVSVADIFGSTASNLINPDNRLKVELPTGSSGLTDSELRASSVPVAQASGANWSVEVTNFASSTSSYLVDGDGAYRGTLPVEATDLDVRNLNVTQDEVLVHQVSGSNWSTNVTNTVTVTGSLTSTVAVGDLASDAADTGSAPVKMGGIARTANPTAVAAGDRVSATMDDLGRQVFRPVQVRDLIATAYVSLSNGTETTLRSATAGSFHDLIYIMGANNSDVAVTVDVRAVTAGSIMMSLQIPANGTAGVSLPVPIPQDATGNNWTVDMADITGTTVYLSALFSREV